MTRRLPAEWSTQDGVLMVWPHRGTDWGPVVAEVEPVFAAIAAAITQRERLLMVTGEALRVGDLVAAAGGRIERMRTLGLPSDDTWARDCGPIVVYEDDEPVLLDWGFNGWGLKFAAAHDNRLTRRLHAEGVFGGLALHSPGLVLEGGAIESDGAGTILTTSTCMLEPNRNPHLDRAGIEAVLCAQLGAERILWLDHGQLAGDDTDGHIDTLARLAPHGTIVYQACDDERDQQHPALRVMAEELADLRTAADRPYRLLPLPWPRPTHAPDGHRTPATYANFLVINEAVLVPTYRQPFNDTRAIEIIGEAFPGRDIVGIDCLPLLQQHGSLHCLTMHLPRGTLA